MNIFKYIKDFNKIKNVVNIMKFIKFQLKSRFINRLKLIRNKYNNSIIKLQSLIKCWFARKRLYVTKNNYYYLKSYVRKIILHIKAKKQKKIIKIQSNLRRL